MISGPRIQRRFLHASAKVRLITPETLHEALRSVASTSSLLLWLSGAAVKAERSEFIVSLDGGFPKALLTIRRSKRRSGCSRCRPTGTFALLAEKTTLCGGL